MILQAIIEISKQLNLSELFKGREKKLQEFQLALAEKMNKANALQVEVNKIEATHKSIFVAGWRPFIGWVCGSSLLYNFILQPFLILILQIFDVSLELPTLQIAQLVSILLAMLGMSGYRTYEKIKLNKK